MSEESIVMNVKRAARRVKAAGSSGVVILGGALVVAIGVGAMASRVAARGAQEPGAANGIAPEGLAQIEALIREKETRTPAEQKIDSQLLYALRMQRGLPA